MSDGKGEAEEERSLLDSEDKLAFEDGEEEEADRMQLDKASPPSMPPSLSPLATISLPISPPRKHRLKKKGEVVRAGRDGKEEEKKKKDGKKRSRRDSAEMMRILEGGDLVSSRSDDEDDEEEDEEEDDSGEEEEEEEEDDTHRPVESAKDKKRAALEALKKKKRTREETSGLVAKEDEQGTAPPAPKKRRLEIPAEWATPEDGHKEKSKPSPSGSEEKAATTNPAAGGGSSSIVDIQFSEADYEEKEEEEKDKDGSKKTRKNSPLRPPSESIAEMLEADLALAKKLSKKSATDTGHVPAIHNGWPLVLGDTEDLLVRCTFANSGKDNAIKPFELKGDAAVSGVNRLAGLAASFEVHWGVFVAHEHTPLSQGGGPGADAAGDEDGARAGKKRRGGGDEGQLDEAEAREAADMAGYERGDGARSEEETDGVVRSGQLQSVDERREAKEQPWFILVGPRESLFSVSSPFFATRVRIVAVDRNRLVFRLNPRARVYYLYEVTEKHLLWPATLHYTWSTRQASRILADTLYAHMELVQQHQDGGTVSERLAHILNGVTGFPIHSQPVDKMLPPGSVSLNSYSERRDRLAMLTKKLQGPVPCLTLGEAAVRGLPVVESTGLARAQMSRLHFLFHDLEKPSSTWTLLDRGVPIEALSQLSRWDTDDASTVRKRFAFLKPLFAEEMEKVKDEDLLSLASEMRLEPEWFNDWFCNLRYACEAQSPERETKRLNLYAIFCASHAWHAYLEQKARYGSNYLFLFTRAQQSLWFEQGCHARSLALEERRRIADPKSATTTTAEAASSTPIPELLAEQKTAMRERIEGALKAMTQLAMDRSTETAKPYLPEWLSIDVSSVVLVEKRVVSRTRNVAAILIELCMRWVMFAQQKKLVGPFASLPPLLVQSVYLYGLAQPENALFTVLMQAAETHKKRALIIRPDDDLIALKTQFKQAAKDLYLLIFDRFHLWSERLIDMVFSELGREDRRMQYAHLVITLHDHTLVDFASTGTMQSDLVEFAVRLQRRLKIEDCGGSAFSSASSGGGGGSGTGRRWRFAQSGDFSMRHFPLEERELQLQQNTSPEILQPCPSLQKLLLPFLLASSGSGGPSLQRRTTTPLMLVVHAMFKTRRDVEARFTKVHAEWNKTQQIVFVTYSELARRPSAFVGNYECILLCDLGYQGAGKPTHVHLNAIFERAKKRIQVYQPTRSASEGSEVLPSYEACKTLLTTVFLSSDSKSDRQEEDVQRLPLLKQHLDRLYYNQKFTAHMDKLIAAIGGKS
jgi:hypothetical protein